MSAREAVSIMRLPITLPCPVPVTPEGNALDESGEPISLELRTELCAVDAGWMMGAQVVCDVHLRACVDDMGAIDGSFEDIVREAYLPWGEEACTRAIARAFRSWESRKRYSQDDARRISA